MKTSSSAAFHGCAALGWAAIVWAAAGMVQGSVAALVMTLAIGVAFYVGQRDLHAFRADTATARHAASSAQAASGSDGMLVLADWLQSLPSGLRGAVRQRLEGERVALPGPALAPYLVGLLVMLGMLGTFSGMVLTFGGVVGALEGSADLAAIRSALAAPIKGLGLAFGSSVAGVAASAALGLMLVLARRERAALLRAIDRLSASVFAQHSRQTQRQAMLGLLQRQVDGWPTVVERLQSLVEGLERRDVSFQERIQAQQERFQAQMALAFERLAGEVVREPLQQLVRDLTDLTERQQQAAAATLAQQQAQALKALSSSHIDGLNALDERVDRLLAQWQLQAQQSAERAQLADEARLTWQRELGEWQRGQRTEVEQQGQRLAQANEQLTRTLMEQAGQAGQLVDSIGRSADQIRTLGDAFAQGVQQFSTVSERLAQSLERVEGALQQSLERSDEQLAYYVGQAREVIDLCLASQQRVLDDLQRLRRADVERSAQEVG